MSAGQFVGGISESVNKAGVDHPVGDAGLKGGFDHHGETELDGEDRILELVRRVWPDAGEDLRGRHQDGWNGAVCAQIFEVRNEALARLTLPGKKEVPVGVVEGINGD